MTSVLGAVEIYGKIKEIKIVWFLPKIIALRILNIFILFLEIVQLKEGLKLVSGETILDLKNPDAPKVGLIVFIGGYTMAEERVKLCIFWID